MSLALLVAGELVAAGDAAGVALTDWFTGPETTWLWRLRAEQIVDDPRSAHWIARAAVSELTGVAVGHAGFHGPPDENGVVEIGYAVDPLHRRRGYARGMVRALLAWAEREPDVAAVRASISPTNAASLATIAGFGFTETGEQWDEQDGLETIFEVSVS
jgi:RimJ/RimL family protein N-acetyltransferase